MPAVLKGGRGQLSNDIVQSLGDLSQPRRVDFAPLVDPMLIRLPFGDVIVEEALDVFGHRTLQLHRANGSSGADAASGAVALGTDDAALLPTNAAKDVPAVGQGKRPMGRVVGN